jgi:hypothetical protein
MVEACDEELFAVLYGPGHFITEDGVIWLYGVDNGDVTLAFTDEGVEEVQLILMEYSRITTSKP